MLGADDRELGINDALRSSRLVERKTLVVGDGSRVLLEDGSGLTESTGKGGEALLELEERSAVRRVVLHAREVPRGELIEIDKTIAIDVKILDSRLDLVIVELLTKLSGHGLELLEIDRTAAILIKLGKGRLNLLFDFIEIHVGELHGRSIEPRNGLGGLLRSEVSLERLAALLLETIREDGRAALADGGGVARDRGGHVVVEEVSLHFEVVVGHVGVKVGEESDIKSGLELASKVLLVVGAVERDLVALMEMLQLVELLSGALVGGHDEDLELSVVAHLDDGLLF